MGCVSSREGKAPSTHVLLIGLDGAGSTTALYHLALGKPFETVPTLGFNHEVIDYHGVAVELWDVGGGPSTRTLWRRYTAAASAIIYLVDATDPPRRLAASRAALLELVAPLGADLAAAVDDGVLEERGGGQGTPPGSPVSSTAASPSRRVSEGGRRGGGTRHKIRSFREGGGGGSGSGATDSELVAAAQVAAKPLVVLANKVDAPGGRANADAVAAAFQLPSSPWTRAVLLPGSAKTGAGLNDALDWVLAAIAEKQGGVPPPPPPTALLPPTTTTAALPSGGEADVKGFTGTSSVGSSLVGSPLSVPDRD
ncbi:hypothetical protein MMPV_004534 [Pyropia vietnamensis]